MAILYFALFIVSLTIFVPSKVQCGNDGIHIDLPIRLCSPNFCELFRCVPLQECGAREVKEINGSICGCCDSCVTLLSEQDVCENIPSPPGGKPVAKCDKEYICKAKVDDQGNKVEPEKCTKIADDDLEKVTKCVSHRTKIDNAEGDEDIKFVDDMWKPKCDSNLNYEPKQCKGRKCFCVGPEGERLFGQAEKELATNMTCLCSLAMYHKKKELDKTDPKKWMTTQRGHCTDMGNFAELQCEDGICFCVHEKTGEIKGRVVKDSHKEFLPCYDIEDFEDDSYFTTCEKQVVRENRILYEFFRKKINIISRPSINCDLDGTFQSKQCDNKACRCTDRKGFSFESYQTDKIELKDSMTCRCARDEIDIKREAAQYSHLTCLENGNFAHFQGSYCVDEDGYRISQTITKIHNELEKDCREFSEKLLP